MPVEVRNVVAGKSRGGEPFDVVDPADFATVVGVAHSADAATVSEALDAAASAAPSWRELSLEKRTDLVARPSSPPRRRPRHRPRRRDDPGAVNLADA